ncbi:GGDEF domain-containing protein [Aureimonas ureilytica]|uniref:GGDEF domain-containing protein n=1 Tax=Aureimonas ureilytica TaxID=401562 RepID=UPI00035D3D2F|nr:GGDEF domain-containing protein [Aureimonas ureilytica]
MLSPLASSISVVSVSLFFGAALLVAWRQFGLKRYAAIWALSFLASAVGHGVRVAGILLPTHQSLAAMLACHASIASFALLAWGFRSRAGLSGPVVLALWASSSLLVVLLWALQPFDWRMASRVVTSLTDAAFIALIVAIPKSVRNISPSLRWVLTLYGLYILSVGIAAFLARPGGEIGEAAFIFVLSLGTPTGMIGTGILTLFVVVADLAGELQRRAECDYLSGVLNRRGFEEKIGERRADAGEGGFMVSADLDRFKAINDRCGHMVGDEVIRRFARHLDEGAKPGDLVGRMGGEEFAVFLSCASAAEALQRVEALRDRLPSLYADLALPMPVTASFGLVRFEPSETFAQAYARADEALYASKLAGRNKTVSRLDAAA